MGVVAVVVVVVVVVLVFQITKLNPHCTFS